ncbi:DNA repair protein [Chlorella vulgaris]
MLCGQCKRQESLISKSTAKQRYSLSDAELVPLGSLRKANPHKKDWQAMHLYLESQVARVSHRKYGGAEGLIQHQQARLDSSMDSKIRRREKEKQQEQREGERLRRIRQRIGEGGEEAVQQAAATAAELSDVEVEEI